MPVQVDRQLTPGIQFVSKNSMNVSQASLAAITLENQNNYQNQNINRIGFNVCVICTTLFDIPEGFCNYENHQN